MISGPRKDSNPSTRKNSQAAGRSWRRRWLSYPGSRGRQEQTTSWSWARRGQRNSPALGTNDPLEQTWWQTRAQEILPPTHTHLHVHVMVVLLPFIITLRDITRQKKSLSPSASRLTDAGRKSYLFSLDREINKQTGNCQCTQPLLLLLTALQI